MKLKKLALAMLSALAFTVTGCDNNVVPSQDVSSSDADKSNSPWGKTLYDIFYKHYGMDVPFPTGAKGAKFAEMEDDYGDPMIVVLCDFEEDVDAIDSAIETYAITALDQGYNVIAIDYNNGHPAYDCSIPYNDCMTLHIQCLYGGMDTDGDGVSEDYLGLFFTSEVSVDPYMWPAELINYVLGFDVEIPAIEGSGITYQSSEIHDADFGNYVSITVYGVAAEDVGNYEGLLKANNYNVEYVESADEDETNFYLAWIDDTFYIQFNGGLYQNNYYIDINIAKGDVHEFFDI